MNLKIYKPTLRICQTIQATKEEKARMTERQKGDIGFIRKAANLDQKTNKLL